LFSARLRQVGVGPCAPQGAGAVTPGRVGVGAQTSFSRTGMLPFSEGITRRWRQCQWPVPWFRPSPARPADLGHGWDGMEARLYVATPRAHRRASAAGGPV